MDLWLERERELAELERCLSLARAGRGALALVEGAAGIGKTRLLREAWRAAGVAGMRVLRGRGAELEREFPYGVVRQLIEPALATSERGELLAGAAALAEPLFGAAESQAPSLARSPQRSGAVLHGLYWLCANLAERAPLLLAVDDAHWADRASLRFLVSLLGRLEELPIAVVVAARPAEDEAERELLGRLAVSPGSLLVRPRPLSHQATRALIAAGVGAEPEQRFIDACRAATGGNPFLLHELVRELAEEAIEPTAAQSARIAALAPSSLARAMLVRLRAIAPDALRLARAVAVLGGDADPRRAGALAGVDDAAARADRLADAGILEAGHRPLAVAHPIVRGAISRDIPAGERADLHAAAARMLTAERAPVDRVAAHLLAAEPEADGAVVETLRMAARSALLAGAPDSAVAYLRRALGEPPPAPAHPALLLELGFAESHAGDPEAAGHLREAIEVAEGRERLAATLALGRTLMNAGRTGEGLEVLQQTAPRDGGHNQLVLDAAVLAAAQLDRDGAAIAVRLAERLRASVARRDDVPASVFGPLAAAALLANEPAERVIELARRALAGGEHVLPETIDRPPGFYFAPVALTLCGQFDDARRVYDLALADARRFGSVLHHMLASTFRAALEYRAGRLADAEADARLALTADPAHATPAWAALAAAALADALRDRGQLDEADAELDQHWPGAEHAGMLTLADLLCSRGCLRLAQARPADALDDLLAAGRHLHDLHAISPAYAPWRSNAALALHALGQTADARRLCAEELDLAHAFGAPRALGIALRAAGLINAGEHGLELLHQGAATLAGAHAPLEHARALADLGAALRRAGHRRHAREPLRTALDLAHRCGSAALAKHARTELIATGARPRRPLRVGADALTPSERRVAEMAATGMTNREIAQSLFVTRRTVEIHLTHSYQKLNISSRAQLPDALAT